MPTIIDRIGTMSPIFKIWRTPLPSVITITLSPTRCTSKIFLPSSPLALRSATTVPLTMPRYIAAHYTLKTMSRRDDDKDDPPTLRTPVAGETFDPDTKPLAGYAFGSVIGRGG